jgi:hypothetical protein
MSKIRASEISTYLYCKRAWWHQQQGFSPENTTELTYGMEHHREHGRMVFFSKFLRAIAFAVLLIAGVFFIVHLVQQL